MGRFTGLLGLRDDLVELIRIDPGCTNARRKRTRAGISVQNLSAPEFCFRIFELSRVRKREIRKKSVISTAIKPTMEINNVRKKRVSSLGP